MQDAARRKRENRIKKIEEEISDLEARKAAIENDMSDPADLMIYITNGKLLTTETAYPSIFSRFSLIFFKNSSVLQT